MTNFDITGDPFAAPEGLSGGLLSGKSEYQVATKPPMYEDFATFAQKMRDAREPRYSKQEFIDKHLHGVPLEALQDIIKTHFPEYLV